MSDRKPAPSSTDTPRPSVLPAELIDELADVMVEAELALREGSVRDAALRSAGYRTGRYSLAEMEQRIAATRAADHAPRGEEGTTSD